VDFKDLPTQFARGKVALNVVSGWDEEGLTAKTFEIVACGVPLVHNECRGLSEIFEPGREVLTFQSPKQCRETIQALLDDEPRREQLAHAALWRMMSDHTWGQRIKQMFLQARLPIESFMNA
jgi:spore maturation protein CgeB